TGKGRTTLAKAEVIIAASEVEPDNPKIKRLVETMDKSGRANGPYRRLTIMRQADAILRRTTAATGQWALSRRRARPALAIRDRRRRSRGTCSAALSNHDHQRDLRDGCLQHHARGHDPLALDHFVSHAPCIHGAGRLGLRAQDDIDLGEEPRGHGAWLREKTEHCIMATRGKLLVELTNQSTAPFAPMRSNSEKPREFFDLVEKPCPAPRYEELFARQQRPRWDGHGDEYPTNAGEHTKAAND